MKDRRLKMILIPLVVGIWTYAVYKYFFWSEEAATPATTQTQSPMEARTPVADTAFTLLANYRDPFLDQPARRPKTAPADVSSSPNPPQPPTQTQPQPPPITVPVIDWSIARFNGLVQRAGSAERDGILSINGRVYHVAQGDVVKGIEVLALHADSIRLQFADEIQTIHKR